MGGQRGLGNGFNRTLLMTEFLVRIGLVTDQHLVTRLDKTNGTARRVQIGAQTRPLWHDTDQRPVPVHRLADLGNDRRGNAGLRRGNHQPPLGLAFGQLLPGAA